MWKQHVLDVTVIVILAVVFLCGDVIPVSVAANLVLVCLCVFGVVCALD